MRVGEAWRGIGRRGSTLLAVLAVIFLVIVPPGFMVGGQGDGRARIVICTGHGPVMSAIDLTAKGAPARGKKADSRCVFAGQATPPTPTPAAPKFALAWTPAPALTAVPGSQIAIGRGLAAPPPGRGPPLARL